MPEPLGFTTALGRFTAQQNNSVQCVPADTQENHVSAPTACSVQGREGEERESGKMCLSRDLAVLYEPSHSFPQKSSSEKKMPWGEVWEGMLRVRWEGRMMEK